VPLVSLTAVQARVVGSLVEKQLTTPQHYPLTANALLLACNQSSNRHPVVAYSEEEVAGALDELRERRLVRFVLPSHGRSVVRYRHVLDEVLGIDASQLAVVAVLLLRGPQTVGELRIRTERMAGFDDLGAVEHELDLLADREDPLVVRLPRRPGQKEERWADLLQQDPAAESPAPGDEDGTAAGMPAQAPAGVAANDPPPSPAPTIGGDPASAAGGSPGEIAALQEEVAGLRQELAELRAALDELRASLGG
jgi:uncharacterized protein